MTQGFTDFDFEAERLNELAKQQSTSLDHQLHVQFYKHAELNSFKTKEAGRKIFEDKIYVRVLMPANRLNIIEREATEDYKVRFAKQYMAFLAGLEQLSQGTPLSELPGLQPAQILELKALKVDTIEQLAGMSDTTAQLFGSGMSLKQQAQRYMTRVSKNEELAESNKALSKEVAELRALVEKMTNANAGQVQVNTKTEVAGTASK